MLEASVLVLDAVGGTTAVLVQTLRVPIGTCDEGLDDDDGGDEVRTEAGEDAQRRGASDWIYDGGPAP